MPTTSNFGWTTPADTDLVKDGAAAIRTLGDNIDASLVDLKGGTTGQVLAKNSNTDLDFTWTNGGDITEVTAGTGLSGGGSSGAVTLTNTVATTFDAKGDLVVGTGADTFAKLEVGTNDYVLTAASGETTGMKWAALPSSTPTYSGCSLYITTEQNITNNTETAIGFDAETFDTDGYHSTTTNNSRITIPSGKAGKYLISGFVGFEPNATGNRGVFVYKNGSAARYCVQGANIGASQLCVLSFSTILDLAVGDYIQIYAWQNSGITLQVQDLADEMSVEVSLLGA